MKPADLKGFTEAGRDTLARILRRVVEADRLKKSKVIKTGDESRRRQ